MKKYFLGAMALSAAITISACSNGGENSNDGTPTAIPEDLSFQPQGSGLTQNDRDQLTAFIAATKAASDKNIPMMLPEFLKVSQSESDSDRREREQDYAKLNSQQKGEVEQDRSYCQYTENKTPMSNDDWAIGKSKVQVTRKNLSGGQCPVTLSETNTQTTTILSVDQQTGNGFGKLVVDDDEVVSLKESNNLDSMSVIYRSMSTHLKALVNTKGYETKTYAVGPMHMSFKLVNGQSIVIEATMQLLQNSKFQKTIVQGTLTIDGHQYSLSMFKIGNDIKGGDLYLNGEKMESSLLQH